MVKVTMKGINKKNHLINSFISYLHNNGFKYKQSVCIWEEDKFPIKYYFATEKDIFFLNSKKENKFVRDYKEDDIESFDTYTKNIFRECLFTYTDFLEFQRPQETRVKEKANILWYQLKPEAMKLNRSIKNVHLRGYHTSLPPPPLEGIPITYGCFTADENWYNTLFPGGSAFYTILHEIGHAFGLAHPHDTILNDDKTIDLDLYSVMSYKTTINRKNPIILESIFSEYQKNKGIQKLTKNDKRKIFYEFSKKYNPDGISYPCSLGIIDMIVLSYLYPKSKPFKNIEKNKKKFVLNFNDKRRNGISTLMEKHGFRTIQYEGKRSMNINLNSLKINNLGKYPEYISHFADSPLSTGFVLYDANIETVRLGAGNDRIIQNEVKNETLYMGGGNNSVCYNSNIKNYKIKEKKIKKKIRSSIS